MIYENKTSYFVNFIVNGFLHATILFIFLSALFYIIISPLVQSSFRQTISDSIDTLFNSNIPNKITISISDVQKSQLINNNLITSQILNNNLIPSQILNNNLIPINNFDQNNLVNDTVSIELLKYMSKDSLKDSLIIDNLIQEYSKINNIVNVNNETIIFYSISISIFLFIITSILLSSFKILYPDYINISETLIESIVTFAIVGVIEYWFFTNYAFKYIPSSASDMIKLFIKNIKNLLQDPYIYTNINNPGDVTKTPIVFS